MRLLHTVSKNTEGGGLLIPIAASMLGEGPRESLLLKLPDGQIELPDFVNWSWPTPNLEGTGWLLWIRIDRLSYIPAGTEVWASADSTNANENPAGNTMAP